MRLLRTPGPRSVTGEETTTLSNICSTVNPLGQIFVQRGHRISATTMEHQTQTETPHGQRRRNLCLFPQLDPAPRGRPRHGAFPVASKPVVDRLRRQIQSLRDVVHGGAFFLALRTAARSSRSRVPGSSAIVSV